LYPCFIDIAGLSPACSSQNNAVGDGIARAKIARRGLWRGEEVAREANKHLKENPMISSNHPTLTLLDQSDWTFHLIGSRFVGKFDRQSDYDFLMVIDKWPVAKKWLEEHGFERQGTGGYGPDRRLCGTNVWTCKVEGFPPVDVFPVSPEEAAFRLRWFKAMQQTGDEHGGKLAWALKSGKGWAHFWQVLERYCPKTDEEA
jgi:hypothetical protein